MKCIQHRRAVLAVSILLCAFLASPAWADADLSVSISTAPNPVGAGNTLTYTIAVTNLGSTTASGVLVTNNLSPGQTLSGGGSGACPQPGPVAWWKGEGNANDGAGSHNGTLQNGAGFDAGGKVGQAFSFDGNDDYVTFPDAPDLRPASFTVEGWFKLTTVSGTQVLVSKTFGDGNLDSFAIYVVEGSLFALTSDGNAFGPIIMAPTPLVAGNWYHIALTFNDSTKAQTLYLNGAAAINAVASQSVGYDAHPFVIGADIEFTSPAVFYAGLADEVSLFNRALSEAEILSINNAGSAGKCTASTLFALGNLAAGVGTSVTLSVLPTICSGVISNVVEVTTTDPESSLANNKATNAVSVVDLTAPSISCVAGKTVECGSVWDFDAPSAADACTTATVAVLTTITNAGPCGDTFTATRTWRATDVAGNHADCSQIVTVEDHTAPTITCVADKTVACSSVWDFDAPTASDTCGMVNVTVLSTVTNSAGGGTFTATRTWTATDACLNESTCSQVVTIEDNTPPTITCAANKVVECGTVWGFDPPTASDSCSVAAITILTTVTNAGSCGNTMTATRTWRATDAAGNHSDCGQVVTVEDHTPPTITCVANKTVECATAWDFDAPAASDSCGNATVTIVGTVTNAGPCGDTFTAIRTWKATDDCSNEATCTQTVTVQDHTAPTLTCVANKTVECNSAWDFDAPTATDSCGMVTVTIMGTVTNAGPCGNTFTATRTWKATDACSNESTCSQIVAVEDHTPPTITCAVNKTVGCADAWNFDAPTASDSCGTAAITVLSTVTNSLGAGTFTATRTWKAIDSCNNEATCSQVVTIEDDTPPTITCVADKTVECVTAWTFDAPTASDTCSAVTVTVLSTLTNAGPCGNTFVATRTWRATDSAGNHSDCSQVVTTQDHTPPVITCVGNKTVECASAWTFDAPSASDTCGNATISIVSTITNAGPCGNTFTATRTWKAVDACSNEATCTQVVTVEDHTGPTITCVANKTVECSSAWTFDAPSASDTCGNATISIVSTVTNAGPCGNTFSATRTWKATDACSNESTCSQVVTVQDHTPPTITCAINKTAECGTAWTFDAPNASDTCGSVTITVVSTVTNSAGAGSFTATRTWKATDACNNESTCSQIVTVDDHTPPSITCVGNKTVECAAPWTFDAPSATDNCSAATIAILTTVTNAGSCGNTIVATRTWRATDAAGNHADCSQVVTVQDHTPPTITCAANKTAECGTAWTFDAPSASDTCGSATVTIVSTVTNASGGGFTATRTWKATDACSNESTCSQIVTVEDHTPPSITCVGNKTVECASAWNFDAPSATDTCSSATVAVLTTVTNAGSCGNTFTTTRTWRATDGAGNHADCSQVVTVQDHTPPTITCAANKTAGCSSPWSFDAPTATDSCGTATIVIVSTVTNAPVGGTFTATRTWKATDSCNNEATCSQTVTVSDDGLPVITCVPNKAVECGSAWTFDAPSAAGGCSGVTVTILSTTTNAGPCGNTFTATRTWRASDSGGNHADCSQVVTVQDHTAPTITCVANKTVACTSAWTFDAPAASDSCGTATVTIVTTITNAGPCGNTFTATRTWKATDACNNEATCSQVVTVEDHTAPSIVCVAAKTVECASAWTFDAPTASDTCGTATITIVGTVTNAGPCGGTFTATRTWKATDACNNEATCSQVVTVEDHTAPTFACAAAKTAECGTAWGFDVPSASDTCGSATITVVSTVTNVLSASSFTVTRTWRATDDCNNQATCSQVVTVEDHTPPTLTCVGNKFAECGSVWDFDGPSATDNCGGVTIAVLITTTNVGPCGDALTWTRTWRATDASGNHADCTQVVTLEDHLPPVLNILGSNPSVIECHSVFTDPGATAADACGTAVLTTNDVVNANLPGNYTITYVAADGCGNSVTNVRNVTVRDTVAPVPNVASLPTAVGQCTVTLSPPTATDACAGTITATTTNPTSYTTVGTFTVTWTYADGNGNTSSQTQTVTVQPGGGGLVIAGCPNNIGPISTAPGMCGAVVTWTAPIVGAGCDSPMISQTAGPASGSTFPVGITTIVYTATNVLGNSTTCSFTVTVVDHVPPAIAPPIFTAGSIDDFTGPELSSPSADLLTFLSGQDLRSFDECGVDKTLAHTFVNLPRDIDGATLWIKMRGCADLSQNDTINLVFALSNGDLQTTKWRRRIGTYAVDGVEGLLASDWTPGSEQEFVLDLAHLPNGDGTFSSLLPAMRQNRFLDLYVTDDTGVDYVYLQIQNTRCLSDIFVTRDVGQCGAVVQFTPPYTDGCDPHPTVVCTPAPGSFFAAGTNTTVTCVATDSSGNTNSCSFTVYVDDPDRPTLSIVHDGSNIVLSWPSTSSCIYALEEANFLAPNFPNLWRRNNSPVTLASGRYSVTVAIQPGNRFFRLRNQ